jgi:hypothetical protein
VCVHVCVCVCEVCVTYVCVHAWTMYFMCIREIQATSPNLNEATGGEKEAGHKHPTV